MHHADDARGAYRESDRERELLSESVARPLEERLLPLVACSRQRLALPTAGRAFSKLAWPRAALLCPPPNAIGWPR